MSRGATVDLATEAERVRLLREQWNALGRPRWVGKGRDAVRHPTLVALQQAEARLSKLQLLVQPTQARGERSGQ